MLALAQSRWVGDALAKISGREIALEVMETRGDRTLDRPLPEIGGKGLFTAELDKALLAGELDLAVHSLKDLPTDLTPGLCLAAVPAREDPRDVVIGSREGRVPTALGSLPRGATLGTSSLRRRALAGALRAGPARPGHQGKPGHPHRQGGQR